ncbi:MAG TPA: Rieske (2Fe-2S) protein [Thermoguttaceae bacterium]
MCAAFLSDHCRNTNDLHQIQQRRGFLAKTTALLAGLAALATPAAVGIVSFLNPLRQKTETGGFIKLTTLDVLPENGRPRKFPVIADRSDAWNYFPNEPIGAVYLRRTGKDQVEALQVICPHAGCSIILEKKVSGTVINHNPANFSEITVPDTFIFACPCHGASFDLSGKRFDVNSASPRDMDSLEVEIREDNEVWVKFQKFATGTVNKVVSG